MTMVTAKAGLKSLAASLKAALSPLALLLMAIKSGFDFDKEWTIHPFFDKKSDKWYPINPVPPGIKIFFLFFEALWIDTIFNLIF